MPDHVIDLVVLLLGYMAGVQVEGQGAGVNGEGQGAGAGGELWEFRVDLVSVTQVLDMLGRCRSRGGAAGGVTHVAMSAGMRILEGFRSGRACCGSGGGEGGGSEGARGGAVGGGSAASSQRRACQIDRVLGNVCLNNCLRAAEAVSGSGAEAGCSVEERVGGRGRVGEGVGTSEAIAACAGSAWDVVAALEGEGFAAGEEHLTVSGGFVGWQRGT